MPLWVLADPHVGADPTADAGLLRLLEDAAKAQADLLILGDLFLAWLGPARFHTPLQAQVIAGLLALRRAGGRVRFVAGNRDYLVEDAPPVFDEIHHGEVALDVGGVRTWVLHGDLARPDDHLYRSWHQLSRSGPVTALLRRAPSRFGQALAGRVEAQLRGTNTAYKSGLLPLPALFAVGRRAAEHGCARALVGHFHHERVLDVPDGAPVVLAPGWCDHQRILVAAAGGRLEGRTPNPPKTPGR